VKGMDFDTQTLSRSPSCIQTRAKPQVTASWIPACLKSLVLRARLAAGHLAAGHMAAGHLAAGAPAAGAPAAASPASWGQVGAEPRFSG
jgi:hypothetical protein